MESVPVLSLPFWTFPTLRKALSVLVLLLAPALCFGDDLQRGRQLWTDPDGSPDQTPFSEVTTPSGGATDDGDGTMTLNFAVTASPTFTGDVTISDTSPSLVFTDTTASEDDFELIVDGSVARYVNTTDGITTWIHYADNSVGFGELGFAPAYMQFITDGTGDGEFRVPQNSIGASEVDTQNLTLSTLGTPTYSTLQHLMNFSLSPGVSSGGTITASGTANAVDVAAGTGFIKATDSNVATLLFFNWPTSTALSVPSGSTRYIGVEYNSGTPQVVANTTQDWDYDTEFPLGIVVNEGGTRYIINNPWVAADNNANIIERFDSEAFVERDNRTGGLILSNTGTRNVAVTAGILLSRMSEFTISALDTSGSSTFDAYYRDGVGGWTKQASATQWNNSQYDDGDGGLATLTVLAYTSRWFYVMSDGSLAMLYGQAQDLDFSDILDESTPSSAPDRITKQGVLIGRFIIRASGTTPALTQTAFGTPFSAASVTEHDQLAGLTDDDHTQYLLIDGTRAMTGDLTISASAPTIVLTDSSGDDFEHDLTSSVYRIVNTTDGITGYIHRADNSVGLGEEGKAPTYLQFQTDGGSGDAETRFQPDSIGVSELDTADDPTNGEALTYQASSGRMVWAAGAGGGNSFETIDVPAGTDPVADSSSDTLAITETSPLVITGDSSTDTLDITWTTLTVGEGGTGATSLTDGGILLGSGTGAITALGVAANGQIPIGDGTTDPVLNEIDGTANEITVADGAGTITISIPDSPVFVTPTIGAATATSVAIGANTLDTNEWAFLDGQDQAVKTTSNVTHAIITSSHTIPSFVWTDSDGDDFEAVVENNTLRIVNTTDSITSLIHYSDNSVGLGESGFAPTYLQFITDGTGNAEFRVPQDSIGADELDTADVPANGEAITFQSSTGRMVWAPTGGADISCRVRNSGNQTLTDGTLTDITFDTEDFDTDTMHSTASETDKITFNTAGTYTVGGGLTIASGTSVLGTVVRIELNDTTLISQAGFGAAGNVALDMYPSTMTRYAFSAGDYIKLIGYVDTNDSGSKSSDVTGTATPTFWANKEP